MARGGCLSNDGRSMRDTCCRAGLSQQAGEDRGWLRRRLGVRPHCARDRSKARRRAQATLHCRGAPGRRRQRRNAVRGAFAEGRLHLAGGDVVEHDPRSAIGEFQFRFRRRPRAGGADLERAVRAHRLSRARREDRQGVHRARQGKAGRADLRRHAGRHHRPSRRAALQPARRHQSGDRALSLDCAGHHRLDDRTHLGRVRHRVERAATDRRQQAHRARGRAVEALGADPGRAVDDGGWIDRRRFQHLDRVAGTGRNSARDRRSALQDGERGVEIRRSRQADAALRYGAARAELRTNSPAASRRIRRNGTRCWRRQASESNRLSRHISGIRAGNAKHQT